MSPCTLFLAPQPYYRFRGVCIAQERCLRAMSAAGRRVELWTYPFGEDRVPPGVTIVRLAAPPFVRDIPIGPSPAKIALGLALGFRLFFRLLRGGVEEIHACEESVIPAALLKGFFDFRLVYDMDDVLSLRVERSGFARARAALAALRALERVALRRADAVLTNSRETTSYARRYGPPGRVRFYHHAPSLPANAAPRLEPRTGRTLLYAGNLEPYQGIDLLLRSMRPLLNRIPETRLEIVGGAPSAIQAFRALAHRLGVDRSVVFLGSLPIEEAFRRMKDADILVSPMTQVKSVPMKLYAYMRSGTPILATDLPNHRELLDERSARLAPPSENALAAAAADLVADPERGAALARTAYARIRQEELLPAEDALFARPSERLLAGGIVPLA